MPEVRENAAEIERQDAQTAFAAAGEAAGEGAAPAAAKATEPASDPKDTKPATAAAEPAADPWEGVPPILKQSFDTLTEQLQKVTATANQVGTAQRHIKALEDQLAALKAGGEAAKAAAASGTAAPTGAQVADAVNSSEKWARIKEDFPEWAEAMDERLAALGKPGDAVDVEGLKKEFSSVLGEATAKAEKSAREFARVDARHPDWEDDIKNEDGTLKPEFDAWMKTQTPEIQALAQSDRAKDAIRMIDLYYEHRKTAADKAADEAANKQRLEQAIPAKGTRAQRQQTPSEREAAEKAFASA